MATGDFAECVATSLPAISDGDFCQGFSGCGSLTGIQPTGVNLNAVLRRIQRAGDNAGLELTVAGNNLSLSQNGQIVDTVALPIVQAWRVGDIKMQIGAGAVEAGWAICDGTQGTPDLRDRFVMASGPINATGGIGGSATHTHAANADNTALTIAQLPAHTHNNGIIDNNDILFNRGSIAASPGGPSSIDNNASNATREGLTSSIGNGDPHSHAVTVQAANNLPPFAVLRFVMKLA